MSEDSVLQEVRAAREAYSRSLGYDVWAMVAALREQDDVGDWPVVRFAPRRPAGSDVTQSRPDSALRETGAAATPAGQS